MKTLEQGFFDSVYRMCIKHVHTVIGNPPDDLDAIYAMIDSTQVMAIPTKSYWLARGVCMISVWGAFEDRASVSEISSKINRDLAKLRKIDSGHDIRPYPDGLSIETRTEVSDAREFWHVIMSLEFEIH